MISVSGPGSLGGVVAEFFQIAPGKDQSYSINYGTFFDVPGRPADHPDPPFLETHVNSGTLGRSAHRRTGQHRFGGAN